MSSVLVFDDFELDAARFELRRCGQRVAVQPKALNLLLHLVVHRERSVPERELRAILWPNETVGSASVRRAVCYARIALGERGDDQSSIRTVRGHGYQFMLPVRELGPGARAAAAVAHPSTPDGALPIGALSIGSSTLADEVRIENDGPVFVGREGVLAMIDGVLCEMLAGQGRGLLLVGEPGIGKTRTLYELARRAQEHAALVWLGRCCEVEGAPAFWPVVQIVRESLKSFGPEQLQALMGSGAANIAQAIPELRDWLPGLPASQAIDSASARFRFFDSMVQFLANVAAQQPLCVLVDDLHCADEPTSRLLAFLVRELERSRVLFAFASRPAASTAAGPRRAYALPVAMTLRSVELHGFTHCEVTRYLELRTHRVAPLEVVARLHQQTGGNPLFLEQVVHACATQPADAAGAWERVAPNLQAQGLGAAIARHLGALSEPCCVLLRAAAVLGREFSAATLAHVAEVAIDAVRDRLAEAAAGGVLQPLPERLGTHRFAHALIRDAVYEQLPPAERARLHGRAGRALEALGAAASDELLPALAEHFLRAAPADQDAALRYTLRAAQVAKQRLAYEEAAQLLDRALELLETTPAAAERRFALMLDRAEALRAAGQSAAARACGLQVAGLARALGAAEPLADAAAFIARAPDIGSLDPLQLDLLREALDALDAGASRQTLLQALLAKTLMYAREPAASAQLALAARRVAHCLPPPAHAEVLTACQEALSAPEHSRERLSIADELASLGHDHGDHAILLLAATARIWSCVELGDMTGADGALRSLETLAEHSRDPFARWRVRVYTAMRALVLGQLDRAEAFAREAHELGTRLAPDCAEHVYCAQLHGVLRLQGRLTEAEALVRMISLRHPALRGWRAVLAGIHADMGLKKQARAALDLLMGRDLDNLERDPFALSTLAPAADLCAQVGDARLARVLYDAVLPYEGLHGNVSLGIATHGPMGRHLGALALRMGEPELALSHLERAIATTAAMPSPPLLALSCITASRAALRTGDDDARVRAAELLGRAQNVAKTAGLWVIARHSRELAKGADLDLPVQRSGSNPPAPSARFGSGTFPTVARASAASAGKNGER